MTSPQFSDVVFKRQDARFDLLQTDSKGHEHVTRTGVTLTEVYEALHAKLRSGEIGYRDWRTPSVTEPFR